MAKRNKSDKPKYYLKRGAELLVPDAFYRMRLNSLLNSYSDHELDAIEERVNYYHKRSTPFTLSDQAVCLNDLSIKKQSAYYLDMQELLRYFPADYYFDKAFGDITEVPETPTLLKSRPIGDNNENSILLKLNKVRHYNIVKDDIPFEKKKPTAVWRGNAAPDHYNNRDLLVKQYYQHPRCNIGQSNTVEGSPDLKKEFLSMHEQLEHKYILSVEGNDVATNLKWTMASNSLCLMRKPRFETWFMEGKLQAGIHYAELKDDFSNLEEVMDYYESNPQEALEIINNANQWVKQFFDHKRELVISLRVLGRYFLGSVQHNA